MRRRAELVDQTRLRITEAAVRLHTTVGPSSTSIAAVAEEAGVTRLTVYRHFRDQDELFTACMGHWAALHPRPDPAGWAGMSDLEPRIRRAIDELYAWYAAVGDEMFPIQRDFAHMPVTAQKRSRQQASVMADAIVGGAATSGAQTARLRAVAGHVISFWTWRSLVVEQGLSRGDAVDLVARWLTDAATTVETDVPEVADGSGAADGTELADETQAADGTGG